MKAARLACVCLLFLPCMTLCGEEISLTPSVQIYDRYGAPLRGFLSARQTDYRPVRIDEISPWMILAAVSLEDKRFFMHPGVDVQAALRALWQNASHGGVVSGASTITQQLARAVSPQPKTLWGKLKEAALAVKLEKSHTKEEILQDYFNRLEFGSLTQGVEAAADYYFNSSAKNLSLSQAAFLAGIIKSPTKYNPVTHFDRALARRNRVLSGMKANGFITPELYQLATEEPVVLARKARPFYAPHFTRLVHTMLPPGTREAHTTLDGKLQQYAQDTVRSYVANLEDEHVTQAAAVVIENATGAVLAYVGSADFNNAQTGGQIDGLRALRQPGSALKPFVYAQAFLNGLTAADLLNDQDTFFEGGFRPRNYDETFHGRVSAREALACSYNVPAVLAMEKAGTANVLDLLRAAGISTLTKEPDFYGLGLALGSGEIRLLELANAYASLARGGEFRPPVFVREPFVAGEGAVKRILPPETAYLVTDILADNGARAAAFGLNSPLRLPFALAAKTGTSKDYRDNFTLAYTPRWTIGVWAGNFDASPMQKVSGVSGAAPVMHDLALYMQAHYPSEPFARPDGVQAARICTQSGLLAGKKCRHTRDELFVRGTQPVRVCDGVHAAQTAALRIAFPQEGDVFKVDPSVPLAGQEIKFRAEGADNSCIWRLNGEKLACSAEECWWRISPGKFTLELSCGGRRAQTAFEVLE